jgi:hypothetical protein
VLFQGYCGRDYKIICKSLFIYLFFCSFHGEVHHSIANLISFLSHVVFMNSAVQEAEASKEGNGWIGAVLKGLKRSSPAGLKITLRSVMVFLQFD